ncbi:MAG: hypothetical protein GWO02_19655, partial [Gammaproteobacteria bacterium]|nr:hypothetical protein [Gammaproteobacteria bacterium]
MSGPISSLELLRPCSLEHALRLLGEDPSLVPLAGCTDLYVMLNAGSPPGRRFLDLARLGELGHIERRGECLSIGALATFTRLRRSRHVRAHLPMLAAAASGIGGAQIQNRGTLGGNIVNASPAADTLPVLAAAGAVVVLRSVSGQRRIPFTAFYTGYRRTVMRPDELVIAVEVPPVSGTQWFRKVGTRAAQ